MELSGTEKSIVIYCYAGNICGVPVMQKVHNNNCWLCMWQSVPIYFLFLFVFLTYSAFWCPIGQMSCKLFQNYLLCLPGFFNVSFSPLTCSTVRKEALCLYGCSHLQQFHYYFSASIHSPYVFKNPICMPFSFMDAFLKCISFCFHTVSCVKDNTWTSWGHAGGNALWESVGYELRNENLLKLHRVPFPVLYAH